MRMREAPLRRVKFFRLANGGANRGSREKSRLRLSHGRNSACAVAVRREINVFHQEQQKATPFFENVFHAAKEIQALDFGQVIRDGQDLGQEVPAQEGEEASQPPEGRLCASLRPDPSRLSV